jgi:hypothetical protein
MAEAAAIIRDPATARRPNAMNERADGTFKVRRMGLSSEWVGDQLIGT